MVYYDIIICFRERESGLFSLIIVYHAITKYTLAVIYSHDSSAVSMIIKVMWQLDTC